MHHARFFVKRAVPLHTHISKTAAVPDCKLQRRDVARRSLGKDKWQARLVSRGEFTERYIESLKNEYVKKIEKRKHNVAT